jgi:influenza virus NS1A-binding protein
MQPDELLEKPMSPMQYARSGLGTAEMNGKLIAAGKSRTLGVTDRPYID